MNTLLLAGYTTVFVLIFAYVVRLQRHLARLENRLADVEQ